PRSVWTRPRTIRPISSSPWTGTSNGYATWALTTSTATGSGARWPSSRAASRLPNENAGGREEFVDNRPCKVQPADSPVCRRFPPERGGGRAMTVLEFFEYLAANDQTEQLAYELADVWVARQLAAFVPAA